MKLIIDIPEEIYKASKIIDVQHEDVVQIPLEVITSGTPLPKGHGRLIDVDNIQYIQLEDSLTVLTHTKGDEVDWYIEAPTIIEADKSESEDKK